MKMYTITTVLLTISCLVNTQSRQEGIYMVSNSVDQFATKLLDTTRRNLDESFNIALSPYTIWTLMAIVAEGADGNTLKQLQNTLTLPESMADFRYNYKQLALNLLNNQNGVQLDITNAIFVTNQYPLNDTFKQITRDSYNVDINTVDFSDSDRTLNIINRYIADATQQRITRLVNPDDIEQAEVFMTSVLFFKGKWRFPFNKTATKTEKFYADDGTTPIGTVEMMYHSAPFPYSALTELKSFVAELPYGDGDKYGMFVIVPSKNEKLNNVLDKLSKMDFGVIIDRLAQAAKEYEDEEIDIYLPKFTVISEYTLNVVLNQMGITDVFNANKAQIKGITPHSDLYLSRMLQKATIEVDEEGTVASSAAGGSFAYKTMKPKLMANKPFAFFIVDKLTRSIIFEGKISNPKGICATCTGL